MESRRAAVADRDFVFNPIRRPRPVVSVVWATRPHHTRSGKRLLAFRIGSDSVDVLVAGDHPRWVPAEMMLSEDSARRWLVEGFRR